MEYVAVDASIVASGELVRLAKDGALDDTVVLVPSVVLDAFTAEARQGFGSGLAELREVQNLAAGHNIVVRFEEPRTVGRPPPDVDLAITRMAQSNDAVLLTSDRVLKDAAEAQGIRTRHCAPKREDEPEFAKYFDHITMSVHLKEGMQPLAKRGSPGNFSLVTVDPNPLSLRTMERISGQILCASEPGDIEISKPGATVIQHNGYRVAITRPPFSESFEITAVHPVVQMSLEQYRVSDKLMERLACRAEGILISGSPGSGKSTLASGLANFYHKRGKIVKTFETPRDLQVDPGITQYTRLDGSFENSADILLLVRPDYTVFDEVRRREDFAVYSDLRLTGVGMIGVVHANSPIDAIQRFVGKIDLGMIPSVLDTVIFVDAGQIAKVYGLELRVKVPAGMTEQDLARPVIEVSNFETGVAEYEIYTFGEENVILPVSSPEVTGMQKLARDRLCQIFQRFDPHARIDVLSESSVRVAVSRHVVPKIIGRGGSNISEMQRELGVHIDVEARDHAEYGDQNEVGFEYSESRSGIVLLVDRSLEGKYADVFAGDELVLSAAVGRRGKIKLPRHSPSAKRLHAVANSKDDIRVSVRDF